MSEYYKNNLNKGLFVSLILHISIVIFLFVDNFFYPQEFIDFSAAVRVDIVGLPEKELPEQVTPAPTPDAAPTPAPEMPQPPPKPEPAASPKPTLPIKKISPIDESAINLKQKNALKKLKRLAALDKIKNEVLSENEKASLNKIKEKKGNIISPGSALSGLQKLEHESYISDLDAHIKQNWTLPQWLSNKNYQTQILVKMDRFGSLVSKQIIKSSGNRSYDEEALATIDKSAPFPIPPIQFTDILRHNGFIVGFPE